VSEFCSTHAVVLQELSKPLVFKELSIPRLAKGQVLVDVFYSGVCRSQLMEQKGYRGHDPYLPHLLGHEGSGVVIDVGAGVTKVVPGDEVVLGWIRGEGIDSGGTYYLDGNAFVNAGRIATFATRAVVAECCVFQKPKDLPRDLAVLFGCALATGMGVVVNQITARKNDLVGVVGCGGIGMSAVVALISLGCRVVAIDPSEAKRNRCEEFGVEKYFDPSDEKFVEEFSSTYPGGLSQIVESGGSTLSIELAFSLLAKNGSLIFASHPPDGDYIRLKPHELIAGKSIAGSWGGGFKPDSDIGAIWDLIKGNQWMLRTFISSEFRLSDVNAAFKALENGKILRPLLNCMI